MRPSNKYDVNEYQTEIVSGAFDVIPEQEIRDEPIRTIAYDREYHHEGKESDREYQYEDKESDRPYQIPQRKKFSKFFTKRCLIGFAIGLITGIIILIAVVVPVAVLTRCSLGTITSTSNWIGKFQMDDACDRSVCCCFTNEIILSQKTSNQLQVSGNVAGICTNVPSTLILAQTMPTGFQTYISWYRDTLRFRLGQDSSYISIVNIGHGACSASGLRISYNSGYMIYMNVYLIIFILIITIINMI
ncbi:hypothetical protein I4U23_005440 [Adineta vaga]|nr:hypothetical protein I4U23_005440 [Adineta vaga]